MVAKNSPSTDRSVYTRTTIAKARALFVVKGMSITQISEKMDVPQGTLANWSAKGLWAAERDKRVESFQNTVFAHAEDENAAFLSSVKTQAEELTEDAFQVARNAVDRDSAKELQMASGAIRNFVEVYRVGAGLDQRNGSGNTVNIGSIFCQMAPLEKQAEPVSTDTAQQPKHLGQ